LDIVRRAWTETNFSHSGTYFQFEDVTVTPRPFQSPMPPIRVAATSPDTFVSIGELGMPIFIAIRHEDARHFTPQIDAYRKAWKASGHPGNGQVFLRAPGFVAATAAEAKARYEVSLLHYFHAQGRLLADSAGRLGLDPANPRWKTAEGLMTMTYDQAIQGSVMIGSPGEVVRKLQTLRDDMGLDGVLLELNCGGKVDHEHEMDALRLLCLDVQPAFH
jgi:alkanesulfonate monooxygenase SsuD/methylene tetrahydromethanopterin reductase-like flavin-dependent oxidoreductase (luciferase family)